MRNLVYQMKLKLTLDMYIYYEKQLKHDLAINVDCLILPNYKSEDQEKRATDILGFKGIVIEVDGP